MCWKVELQPVMRDADGGRDPGLRVPDEVRGVRCLGTFPRYALVYEAECACGIVGEGKAVDNAEHFLGEFLRQPGVAAVKLAWFWDEGGERPSCSAQAMAYAEFARLNEAQRLTPNVEYVVSLPERAPGA